MKLNLAKELAALEQMTIGVEKEIVMFALLYHRVRAAMLVEAQRRGAARPHQLHRRTEAPELAAAAPQRA